jgi:hypothetical protein
MIKPDGRSFALPTVEHQIDLIRAKGWLDLTTGAVLIFSSLTGLPFQRV